MTRRALFWSLATLAPAIAAATGKPVILEGDTAPALPYTVLREVADPSVNDFDGEAYRTGRIQADHFALKASESAAMDDATCTALFALGWQRITGGRLPDPNMALRRRYSDFTNEL